jgi:hypothetical protein
LDLRESVESVIADAEVVSNRGVAAWRDLLHAMVINPLKDGLEKPELWGVDDPRNIISHEEIADDKFICCLKCKSSDVFIHAMTVSHDRQMSLVICFKCNEPECGHDFQLAFLSNHKHPVVSTFLRWGTFEQFVTTLAKPKTKLILWDGTVFNFTDKVTPPEISGLDSRQEGYVRFAWQIFNGGGAKDYESFKTAIILLLRRINCGGTSK